MLTFKDNYGKVWRIEHIDNNMLELKDFFYR